MTWPMRLISMVLLGPCAAIVTALTTGFLRILYFLLLKPGAHLDAFLVMLNLAIVPFIALYEGAIGAAIFLVPALVLGSFVWPSRTGYGIAGAAAGLLHSIAARKSVTGLMWEEFGPTLNSHQWLFGYRLMAWARDPLEVAIVFVAAIGAGALAGLVYARLTMAPPEPASY